MSRFITILLQVCPVKLVRSYDLCRSAKDPCVRVTGRGSSPGWRRLLLNKFNVNNLIRKVRFLLFRGKTGLLHKFYFEQLLTFCQAQGQT